MTTATTYTTASSTIFYEPIVFHLMPQLWALRINWAVYRKAVTAYGKSW